MADPADAESLQRIENQHSKLLRILQQISEARMVREGHPVTLVLLEGLRELLLEHFRDEEAFMEAIGYPELSGHKWQHETLMDELLRIETAVRSGDRELSIQDVKDLAAILHDHTKETDAVFLSYYSGAGGPTH